jgi:hypothetical protein
MALLFGRVRHADWRAGGKLLKEIIFSPGPGLRRAYPKAFERT